mmetsp:Transcript_26960/g.58501  ORF Transcript_26960/g.58501 Transcript_26960/m.58501 type:complete len:174 (-) Transcript_26960:44-565(-)
MSHGSLGLSFASESEPEFGNDTKSRATAVRIVSACVVGTPASSPKRPSKSIMPNLARSVFVATIESLRLQVRSCDCDIDRQRVELPMYPVGQLPTAVPPTGPTGQFVQPPSYTSYPPGAFHGQTGYSQLQEEQEMAPVRPDMTSSTSPAGVPPYPTAPPVPENDMGKVAGKNV